VGLYTELLLQCPTIILCGFNQMSWVLVAYMNLTVLHIYMYNIYIGLDTFILLFLPIIFPLCSPVTPIMLLKLTYYYQIMLNSFVLYTDKISHFLLY